MKAIRWILVLVIAAALLSWFAYKNISERRAESRQKQDIIDRQHELRSRISQFAGKYNAVTNWQQRFNGTSVFTVDAEDAVTDLTNRPVLFVGSVEDLARRDGKNYVYFNKWDAAGPDIRLVLESTDDQFSTIRRQTKEMVPVYAVITRISSIKKTSTETAAASSDGSNPLTSTDSAETFVATGQCVEMLPLGDDVLDISWP